MGPSALPSPVSPSSFSLPPLHSPLDDWFTTCNSDHLFDQPLSRDGLSSTSGSSSSSSSPAERPVCRNFLHNNDLDGGLHLQGTLTAFSQIGSPVLSTNSASKEKPESPRNTSSGCVSAITNCSMPNANATDSSGPKHFQAFHGGLFQLGNPILQPSGASAVTLSSAASAGAGVTKVSKRRQRVNKKAPIAVLSADTSNFRAMVQQLTGIPPSHTSPAHIWGSSAAPLLRPQPTRFAYTGGLPTLDTSASYFGPRQILPLLQRAQQPFMNGLLSGGASNKAAELASSQGGGNLANYDTSSSSSLTSLPGLWAAAMGNDTLSGNHMKGNMKELSAANLVRECEQSFPRQASSLFESLLMPDDDAQTKSSFNAVDAWLAFDGAALVNHSPRVDLAKIAS